MKIECADFSLEATLESGQVFGFEKNSLGGYEGVLLGRPIRIEQRNGFLNVKNGTSNLTSSFVRHYFDLERDLESVYTILREDSALAPSFEAFKGLRLIRQDAWEALACFILSSNNNIKRIVGIYRNLVKHFGGFPSAEQIARSHEKPCVN